MPALGSKRTRSALLPSGNIPDVAAPPGARKRRRSRTNCPVNLQNIPEGQQRPRTANGVTIVHQALLLLMIATDGDEMRNTKKSGQFLVLPLTVLASSAIFARGVPASC